MPNKIISPPAIPQKPVISEGSLQKSMIARLEDLDRRLEHLEALEYIAESGTTQAIQGYAVQDEAPADGEGLFYVAANNRYEPSAPPLIGCRLRNSANEATATGIYEYLNFDTESYDTDSMHEGVTNPSRITIKTAGVYAFGASIMWEANATGERAMLIYLNRATVIGWDGRKANSDAGRPTSNEKDLTHEFSVNDYIEVRVRQTSGGNLNVESSSDYSPVFWAYKIGDPT